MMYGCVGAGGSIRGMRGMEGALKSWWREGVRMYSNRGSGRGKDIGRGAGVGGVVTYVGCLVGECKMGAGCVYCFGHEVGW